MHGDGVRAGLRISIVLLFASGGFAFALPARKAIKNAPRSSSLTFMKRDGACVEGPIAKIDPRAVTVGQSSGPAVSIQRSELLRVSQSEVGSGETGQGDALVFSARSSWADVEAAHLSPHETLLLGLRNGKTIQGRPFRVAPDSIVFKVGLWRKKSYSKSQIVTVDYLRVKPDSVAFDYFAQEAPAMLFFYPDFYDRLKGLEGKVPVRLYNALQPENDAPLGCLQR